MAFKATFKLLSYGLIYAGRKRKFKHKIFDTKKPLHQEDERINKSYFGRVRERDGRQCRKKYTALCRQKNKTVGTSDALLCYFLAAKRKKVAADGWQSHQAVT